MFRAIKKYAFVIGVSLMAQSQAFAFDECHYLLGFDIGYAVRDGELTLDIAHPAPGSQVTHQVNKYHDNGILYGFFGGYEVVHKDYLAGIELNIGLHDYGDNKPYAFTDILGNNYSGSAEFDRNVVTALSVRFGYKLAPWVWAYIRGGVETSNDDLIYQATSASAAPIAVSISDGRRVTRALGGFGFEFPVFNNVNIRAEYNHSTRSRGVSVDRFASDSVTLFSPGIKPLQHAFKLAFVWNFDFSYLLED